jgi:7,8-dihydro-6-hydroxymethylpterin-pyrophosphokinase
MRTSFDALAKDYAETVLAEFNEKERAARVPHLDWWSKQFVGLTLAEVTADRISKARDLLVTETVVQGKPHEDRKTGETLAPQEYTRAAQQ